MAETLEKKLEKLSNKANKIKPQIQERDRNKTIKCSCCNKDHIIGEITAIQTHFYVRPSGCTEGDYWKEGELQFVCPKTGIANRLLFDNTDVPYNERDKFDNNPDEQFKEKYKLLFKEVKETYEKELTERWINNYKVDNNRQMYGLVEKRK